jgi:hypothetical protein
VVVATREDVGSEVISGPGGRWRDVLSGEERSFDRHTTAASLLGRFGVGVFERLGR